MTTLWTALCKAKKGEPVLRHAFRDGSRSLFCGAVARHFDSSEPLKLPLSPSARAILCPECVKAIETKRLRG